MADRPTMGGLISLTSKLLDETEKTNELLEALNAKMDQSQGTPGGVPGAGGEQDTPFSRGVGKVAKGLTTFAATLIASTIALERLATGVDRLYTNMAREMGSGMQRGQAAAVRMVEEFTLARQEGLGFTAVRGTREAFGEQGLFVDVMKQAFIDMAEYSQNFGLDAKQTLAISRQLVATGAGRTLGETFTMVTDFARNMARRGLSARKAVDALNQVPDLVTKFGSATDEELMGIIETTTKLGISARKAEDTLMGMSAKGFDGLVDSMATLQTIMPGVAMDFNEMANVVEFGSVADQFSMIRREFAGMDFTQLGRTQRRALQDMFGYSIDELQRIVDAQDVGQAIDDVLGDGTDPDKERNEKLQRIADLLETINTRIADFMSPISGLLGGISQLLSAIVMPLAGLWATLKVAGFIRRGLGSTIGAGGRLIGRGLSRTLGAAPMLATMTGPQGLAGARSATGMFSKMGAGLSGAAGFGGQAVRESGRVAGSLRTGAAFGKTAGAFGRGVAPLAGMIGAIGSGIGEYRDTGDMSRAASAGVGGGLGAAAGMGGGASLGTALGAGIGTLVLPGVGTAIGSVLGGIAGSTIGAVFGERSGSWLGKKFNDMFFDRDKDFDALETGVPEEPDTTRAPRDTMESKPAEQQLQYEKIMETITPVSDSTNVRLDELIDRGDKNTDTLSSKLDEVMVSNSEVAEAIRRIRFEFPDSVRLSGNSIEFAGKVLRDAYDHSVRNP